MNKPYLPMTDEIAIELVKQWIKPDNPPLGMPFGWTQPNDDSTIILGSVYSCNYEKNLYDLLINEIYNPRLGKWGGYEIELKQSLDITKRVLRILKENKINIRTNKITLHDVLFNAEEISTTFNELDNEEKCMFRLSIMCLNTMTNGHNLAIEYLEYLAHNHFGDNTDNDKNWIIYESEYSDYKDDILQILAESPENLGIMLDYNSPEYDLKGLNVARDYPEEYQYIQDIENRYNDNYEYDLLQDVFKVDLRSYERQEILEFLTWCIGWIKEEYATGNLTLTYAEDIDSKPLKQWLYQYANQTILPTFENLD